MTHGSLFSGIGGFDLAAEWMGWENIFHCEWNEFGQKVLKHYWPKAISYHDITKTDFTIHRGTIDILTGGFPCQPYSMAGKRKGKEDERHLWPEMLRTIREIQPRWVVGENVFGLVNWSNGLVFHEVQTDLEASGYEVFPYVLNAASVGAPHKRDRVWFVAYRDGERSRSKHEFCSRGNVPKKWINKSRTTSNPNSNGLKRSDCQHEINASEGGEYAQRDIEQNAAANPESRGTRGLRNKSETTRTRQGNKPFGSVFGVSYAPNSNGIGGNENERWPNGKPNEYDKTCAPGTWQNFPTKSPICTGNDGISTRLDGITFSKWRNESIKAAGNAIVPQVALQIFKAIEQYEKQTT